MREKCHQISSGLRILELNEGRSVHSGERSVPASLQISLTEIPNADDIRQWLLKEEATLLANVRSGQARAGLDFKHSQTEALEVSDRRIIIPGTLHSRRNLPDGEEDRLLHVVSQIHRDRRDGGTDLKMGRILVQKPEAHLRKSDIEEAISRHELWLPEGASIDDNGIISVPLGDYSYLWCEQNFSTRRMAEVMIHGRRKLRGIQALSNNGLDPGILEPDGFFVGGKNLSLGLYNAVLERSTSDPSVEHLAAFILDAIRTTGKDIPRQVELYNHGGTTSDLRELRIRMKLYPINGGKERIARRVISPKTLERGVRFEDLVGPLESHSPMVLNLIDQVGGYRRPENGEHHSVVITEKGVVHIPWLEHPAFQQDLVAERVTQAVAKHTECYENPVTLTEDTRNLVKLIGLSTGTSDHRIYVSDSFPEPQQMMELANRGIGVFVAHHLHEDPAAYQGKAPQKGDNRLFFSASDYEAYRELERKGVKLMMVFKETADPYRDDQVIPRHVRMFHHGAWTRPELIERFNKVTTYFTAYGSAVPGLEELVTHEYRAFFATMKEVFGEEMGVTHGKGPGIMIIADKAAEELDIPRKGVGIHIEKLDNQLPNYAPGAMADFWASFRLPRQQEMNNINLFPIFGPGGVGSNEENGITVCDTKVLNVIPTPIIFFDPTASGPEDHYWKHAIQQYEQIAEGIQLPSGQKLPLSHSYVPKLCHLVSSLETEAAKIIKTFRENPIAYWEKIGYTPADMVKSLQDHRNTSQLTGVRIPTWLEEAAEAYASRAA